MQNHKIKFLSVLVAFTFCSCSNPHFKSISASLLSSTGYVNNSQAEGVLDAGSQIAESQKELTTEQEYYLGRAVAAKILAKFPPVTDPALTAYVNKVGRVVAAYSDVPDTFGGYHFVVLNSDQINAMAAPGGYIFVTKKFVKDLKDEDSLAAVLAHEVGHVVKRHGVNAISNGKLFSALGTLTKQGASIAASQVSSPVDLSAVTDVFSESVSGVADKLLTSGYDRKQEYESDRYAVELLKRAGYDPLALDRVLKTLETEKSSGGWYATHPDPDDRIDELEDVVKPEQAITPPQIRVTRFEQATKAL